MKLRILLLVFVALALEAQHDLPPIVPQVPPEDLKLPNGKSQRQEMLKADYQKTLEDARELSKLADELKADLEKSDYNVLPLATLKKTEDIDKLAKRIHDRLKRY